MSSSRIYLDNAATSWPKPEAVYSAADRYQRDCGAAAGRGAYSQAMEAERVCAQTRNRLSRLLNAKRAEQIAFTLNGTDSLNQAIFGVVQEGDHVITTAAEHNSVLRPLHHLESEGRITLTVLPLNRFGQIDLNEFEAAFKTQTKLVAITHSSNVTGTVQPVAEVIRLSHEKDAFVLVDAAQTLGRIPIDVRELNCDLLCSPGHKGLLGPLGTGILYVGENIDQHLRPTRFGGTGSLSESDSQPWKLPDRLESGNLNVPGLAGLDEGMRYLEKESIESIRKQEIQVVETVFNRLKASEKIEFFGPIADPGAATQATSAVTKEGSEPDWAEQQMPTLSFRVEGQGVHETAAMLDQAFSIQVRAGFHCAAKIHEYIESEPHRGTVRLSPGPFNTVEHANQVADAVLELIEA